MRRLLLVACTALLVSATACDPLGDDVAATVEGEDITVDQVRALAAAPVFNQGEGRVDDSVMDGTAARAALSTLIQFQLTTDELERRGGDITAEDRETVDQQYGQDPTISSLDETSQQLVLDSLARQVALDRLLRDIDPTSAAERRELFDRTPSSRRVRCFEALVAPEEQATEVEAALDDGATIPEVIADGVGGAQGLVANGEQCRAKGDMPSRYPAEVVSLLYDSEPGTTAEVTVPGSTGANFVVVAHIVGDKTLRRDDPETADLVEMVRQGGLNTWLPLVLPDAEVEVSPQFGRGFSTTRGVIPPVAPKGAPTTEPLGTEPAP